MVTKTQENSSTWNQKRFPRRRWLLTLKDGQDFKQVAIGTDEGPGEERQEREKSRNSTQSCYFWNKTEDGAANIVQEEPER